jgi:hypothetical protein
MEHVQEAIYIEFIRGLDVDRCELHRPICMTEQPYNLNVNANNKFKRVQEAYEG